jgi:hypothetical protein
VRIRWRWRLRNAVLSLDVDVVKRILYHRTLFVQDVVVYACNVRLASYYRVAVVCRATRL